MRPVVARILGLFLLSSLFLFAAEKPTNVLLITVDTLRADHLSSWGYHLETSPNIDKLAAEGTRFSEAYTVTSRTAPSHFSILTSRYPQEHGAKLNGFAVPEDSKFLFLPQIFKKYGYENGAFISAWPLTSRLTKLDRFFDVYNEHLNRSYQAINSMRYAEDVAPVAMDWMERNKDKPFFLWVHFFDPHSPYDLREDYIPTKKTGKPDYTEQRGESGVMDNVNGYNSEILYTDHWIGEVLARLDKLGLRDNTLVVLTADHGESIGERGYQGHSRRLWESIVHIPIIFRWPGKIEAGRVVDSKIATIDLMPTIVDLTVKRENPAAEIPTEFAGRSLAKCLTEEAPLPDRTVRYVAFAGQKWVMPKWFAKLWLHDLDFPLRTGYREGDHKVIWTPENEELLIYNLKDDPFEQHPLTPDENDKDYKQETAELTRWFKATNLTKGENKMTERDKEALESLGYIQ